jgi:hypothetical protein
MSLLDMSTPGSSPRSNLYGRHAVLGPRNGFQAPEPNQASAGQAFTKTAISNTAHSGFNQLQHPMTVMSLSEEEFLGRAIDSTIGDVHCGFIDGSRPSRVI